MGDKKEMGDNKKEKREKRLARKLEMAEASLAEGKLVEGKPANANPDLVGDLSKYQEQAGAIADAILGSPALVNPKPEPEEKKKKKKRSKKDEGFDKTGGAAQEKLKKTEDSTKADASHGESGHGESGHGESGHGESGHGESGHGESGHGESGKQENRPAAGSAVSPAASPAAGASGEELSIPLCGEETTIPQPSGNLELVCTSLYVMMSEQMHCLARVRDMIAPLVSADVVKVCQRKRPGIKLSTASPTTPKKRRLNGYQFFCKVRRQETEDHMTLQELSASWALLSSEEKEKYKALALESGQEQVSGQDTLTGQEQTTDQITGQDGLVDGLLATDPTASELR
ncbi:hypothetical protein GNI_010450 [Gregarina niphandrodes]|uniref:Uncharacterized protein n=1 Tax=Gregarina niphandrodes TaxID=110365 RepID=A0A023BCT9_GRENI|nr:hypothetical protein GNI_010450 [Gregarina niphandrodes]EZG86318.1 hypothetical protein GNI_010450 [Gregarina niphandrodes]|eukprot:XP_011128769.1 hypothetical protein GNI_010450 [Gregarina niphandrodes]